MNLKIDSKTVLAFIGVFSGGVVVGAAGGITLYKERKAFREWVDNRIYPELKQFAKDNGMTILRILIVTALENNSKAMQVFLKVADSIEKGNLKLPKQLEKEVFKIKNELPPLMKELEKKAIANN